MSARMKDKWGHVCIGGTFSPIHSGHMLLLKEAFRKGRQVSVGLTSDEMAVRTRERQVETFDVRKKKLISVLDEFSSEHDVPFSITEISDRFGFAIRAEIDSIVVSEETVDTVDEIDEERKRNGLPPLIRYVVPMLGAKDGQRISSTRIFHGEIDTYGNILRKSPRRLCVHSASKNPDKAQGLIHAFRRHASGVQLLQYDVTTEIGEDGGASVIEGARSRCELVLAKNQGGKISSMDYFVGIESGMVEMKGSWFMFHCCVIRNNGFEGVGLSSGIEIPGDILEMIMVYKGKNWETKDILGIRRSMIENLSGGSVSRSVLVEECCRNALLSLSSRKRSGEMSR